MSSMKIMRFFKIKFMSALISSSKMLSLIFGSLALYLTLNLFLALNICLICFSSEAFSQEEEVLDLNSLKNELQNSRNEAQTSAVKSNEGDLAPLEGAKKNLDLQEEALMQKLQGIVPSDEAKDKAAERAKADLNQQILLGSTDSTNVNDSVEKNNSNTKKAVQVEAKVVQLEPKKEPKLENLKPLDVAPAKSEVARVTLNEKQAGLNPVSEIGKEKTAQKNEEVSDIDQAKPLDQAKVASLDSANLELNKRVGDLQTRLREKSRELEETRNRLAIAETQVERLSGILEKMNGQKLAGYLSGDQKGLAPPLMMENHEPPVARVRNSQPAPAPAINPVVNKSKEDSVVGIVTAQKAFLRSGPSKEDSPLMSVSKGTRLLVETQVNGWYRVITPTGGRAWIATDMMVFGPGIEAGSNSALRIGGYEKAFQ